MRIVGLCLALLLFLLPAVAVSADSTTLLAAGDALIMSANPTTRMGTQSGMRVGYSTFNGVERSLALFGLASLPANAEVCSARLEAYHWLSSYGSPGMEAPIHRLTQSWTERTVTWEGMGEASDPMVYAIALLGSPEETMRWVTWDVTELVRAWHNGTHENHGLAIHGQVQPPANTAYLRTREDGELNAPRLVVVWTVGGCEPTPTVTPTEDATVPPVPTSTVTASSTATATVSPTPAATVPPTVAPSPTATATATQTPAATVPPTVAPSPSAHALLLPLVFRS